MKRKYLVCVAYHFDNGGLKLMNYTLSAYNVSQLYDGFINGSYPVVTIMDSYVTTLVSITDIGSAE